MALQFPPRLPGLPILGNLFEFRKDRLTLYTHMHETLGEIGEYRLLSKSFILLSNTELIRELLTEHHLDSDRSPIMLMMKPILGEGLLTTDNENNAQQRLWMNPVFHSDRFNGYAATITRKTTQFIDSLNDQQTLNFSLAMQELTLSIIGESLFSIDTPKNHSQFSRLVNDLLFATDQRLKFFFPVPISCPLPMNRRLTQSLKPLKHVIYNHIKARRQNPNQQNDLLYYLLQVKNDQTGEKLSNDAICEQILTFLFAGHETTASTLTWAFYCLAQNPAVYARLQNEASSVLGEKTVDLADLKKLPYSLQVIKETLRLYPSAYAFGRTAKKDFTLGKYKIKKGQVVLVSPYIVHRRADYFENPTQFNPDRFSPENETRLIRNTWIPFGMGPRACFGRQFAMMEAQLILVLLTQKGKIDLISSSYQVEPEAMITLRPAQHLHLKFQKLKTKALSS